jgi:hypothetical protein
MKTTAAILLVSAVLSAVTAHQIPLHERDYTPDSVEELKRKWGFEVCDGSRFFRFEGGCGVRRGMWYCSNVLILAHVGDTGNSSSLRRA